jgi:cell division protein FtsL
MVEKELAYYMLAVIMMLGLWIVYLLYRIGELKIDIKGWDHALVRCHEEKQKLEIKKNTMVERVKKVLDVYETGK